MYFNYELENLADKLGTILIYFTLQIANISE
jgi:hypothetical protein